MAGPTRILVLEDETTLLHVIRNVLEEDGHEVVGATSGEEGLKLFRARPFDLVLTDIVMGRVSGMEVLRQIGESDKETLTIVMTSHASLETAVDALRGGAYDFLVKPFEDLGIISGTVTRAIDKLHLERRNRELMQQLKQYAKSLESANDSLESLVSRDGLTELFNHKFFREALDKEIARSGRHGRDFSLIFADIDHFKEYNDTHGHLAGDELLKQMARLIQDRSRKSTIVARYGGEEFVLLLPEANKFGAERYAERLRTEIAEFPFEGGKTQPLGKITLSLGVSSFPEDARDPTSLIDYADKALYRAKHEGRNRVCVAAPDHAGAETAT